MVSLRLSLLGVAQLADGAFSPIVLDDASALFTGGKQSCTNEGYAGSFHHNGGVLSDEVQTFAEYHFEPPEDGCYLVEEYHPSPSETCGEFAPQYVPITINFCKNLTTAGYIQQGRNGGMWNKIAKLPFYKGWNASILLTREGHALGSSMSACHSEGCFWMADAFRLTYLAADCREPAVRAEMEKDEATDGQSVTTTEVPTSKLLAEGQSEATNAGTDMALRAVVDEPHVADGQAQFKFQPPVDGCYMIEERHPAMPEVNQAPLKVAYCKGRSAEGVVDYTAGRSDRWNYVASLPFFVGEDGVFSLPAHFVGNGLHEFRLTHIGARCNSEAARPQQVTLRMTADFSHVADRLATFADSLLELLSDKVESVVERFVINQMRSGSIVVDMTVLPAAAIYGADTAHEHASASFVAQEVARALLDNEFSSKVCDLVHVGAQECKVRVESSYPSISQVTPVPVSANAQRQMENMFAGHDTRENTIIFAAVAGGAGALALLSVCLCIRRRRVNAKGAADTECSQEAPQDAEKGLSWKVAEYAAPTAELDADKDAHSDEASTATPVDLPVIREDSLTAAEANAEAEGASGN